MAWNQRADDPQPADDSWRPTPGKKNTKRWCKGKVGREHTPGMVIPNRYRNNEHLYVCKETDHVSLWAKITKSEPGIYWNCWHEEVCTTCGKVLNWAPVPEKCPVYQAEHEDVGL